MFGILKGKLIIARSEWTFKCLNYSDFQADGDED